jgi:transcriptional regulator with XRE-family HTH domain
MTRNRSTQADTATRFGGTVTEARPDDSTLAAKIDRLFHVVRRPNREPYSHEDVARACRDMTGESFSATYLWQLRTGRRNNPTKRHLEALANFFQVPPAYFFDDDRSAQIAAELDLLAAIRDNGVRQLALRAAELSPEGLRTITDVVEAIGRREAEHRRKFAE